MLETIVSEQVAVVEAFGDVSNAALFPIEEEVVARAVDKRRREFTTARVCAREALCRLGLPPTPIPRGRLGAPVWPTRIVGSISHCAGYRAAAVARTSHALSIGVDAEDHAPLPTGVLPTIATPEERANLRGWSAVHPLIHWDRLLFSAKESVYKAWFPMTHEWLDFDEIAIRIDPVGQIFTARLQIGRPRAPRTGPASFHGRWLVRRGLILTAVEVPARNVEVSDHPNFRSARPTGMDNPGYAIQGPRFSIITDCVQTQASI